VPGLCVIGLQWGDEAKGKLVDWLTRGREMVVRYQGGANAGHTVVVGDEVYKLHHIPSGILNAGVLNLVTPGVVIHPPTILAEIDSLTARGIQIGDRLRLSERAHVVMPWHILEDEIWHWAIPGEDNIGTTLRGIGPCYRDKVGRLLAVRLGDLFQPRFSEQIKRIVDVKIKVLSAISNDVPLQLDAARIASEFTGYAERLRPYVADTTRILLDAVEAGKEILFEGAQGSLLDIDHGTFPFVTSSNSSGLGISAGSGVAGKWIHKTIGVSKSYCTRVGGGPFPTELLNEVGEHIRVRGKEFGTTTGRPRRCGWFDAVAVRYTCRLSGVDCVALTMLDVLGELSNIEICVAYELNGKRIDHFPSHINELKRVRPIYESIPGWQTEISGARQLDDLPAGAIAFAGRIQELIGCPIEFISVGPQRAQTIVLNSPESLLKSSAVG
jgi:adenylosuccinate synthase